MRLSRSIQRKTRRERKRDENSSKTNTYGNNVICDRKKNSTDFFYELRKTESRRQSQKLKAIRQNPRSRREQQVHKDVTQASRTWEKTKEELQGETEVEKPVC